MSGNDINTTMLQSLQSSAHESLIHWTNKTSRFSSNSEDFASELLENREEMSLIYNIQQSKDHEHE